MPRKKIASECEFPGCGYKFKSANTLKGHEQRHRSDSTVVQPHACNQCSYSATRLAVLKNHIIRRHTDDYPFTCSFPGCVYRAKTASDVRVHRKNRHTPFPKISCSFEGCSYKTKFRRDLKCHVLNCHTANRKKNIGCPLCPQKFIDAAKMREHLKTHTNEKPWKCSQCQYAGKNNAHIRRHFETVHGKLAASSDQKVLKCEICEFSTAFMKRLKSHVVSNGSDQPYACKFPGCSYRSKWKNYLEVHMVGNHAPERHLCPQPDCQYVGAHKKLLRMHIAGFHKKRFRCAFPVCNKRFESKVASINHQRFHDPTRPIQCELCHLRFTTRISLASHIRFTHSKEKPLKCPNCDYRTNARGHLRSHLKRIHQAEDIACSEPGCDFQSCSPYDMMKHSERHDEKSHPFKCEYCPYGFTHNTSLTKHVK